MNKKKKSTNTSPYPDEVSKEKQSVPTGSALLYISLSSVDLGRVRPGGAPCFFFVIYPMYQTAYSYGRNNSSLPCHNLTLSAGEPDNAATQTGAGTSFGANGDPLT